MPHLLSRRLAAGLLPFGAALALLLPATAQGAGAPRRNAATFTVTTTGDPTTTACPATAGSPCSLRAAVTAAAATSGGATVQIGVPGTITLTSVSGGQIGFASGTVTVVGASDGSTVIHAAPNSRIFEVGFASTSTASLTLQDVELTAGAETIGSNGSDDGFGGAIDVNSQGSLTVQDARFSGNTAECNGGAIDVNTASSLSITRTTFDANAAGAGAGSLPVSCRQLSGPVFGSGGAVDLNTLGSATIIDSTFTQNTARDGGSAITTNLTGRTATLSGDTLNANSVTGTTPTVAAAIVDNGTASVTVSNTILAANGTNCAGLPVTDGGNNLDDGTSCGFTTNARTGDPQLGALAANGGFAPTESLKPGSPAIDAGSDTTCSGAEGGVDERTVPRAEGAHCDIGAFEVVQTATTLTVPTTAAPGATVSLVATVTPKVAVPGQPAGIVTFLDGSTVLGTAPATGASPDTVTFTTGALAAGTHSFTARFSQTPLFLGSTSAAAPLTAVAAVSTTTTSTTSSSSATAISAPPNTGGGGAGAVAGSGATSPITGAGLVRALALGLLLIGAGTLATARGRLRRR